jgi:hypothetical protein
MAANILAFAADLPSSDNPQGPIRALPSPGPATDAQIFQNMGRFGPFPKLLLDSV